MSSGKKKGKKAQERPESPPPIIQPPDSEHEVGSLVNDAVEEPVASVSTRSKRRRSSVAGEKDPPRPKGKQGRPPGKRPHELEAELAGLHLEPVILDDAAPPPKRRRGRPPGIPANEMGSKSRLQSEPVVDDPELPAPKRKRGRPPGIPSHELEEQVQSQSRLVAIESAPSMKRKRSGPPGIPPREMDKQAQPESKPVADEPSPPPKRKRGHPPGISSREMEKQARSESEPVNELSPSPPKLKRGHPPGKRLAEFKAEDKQTEEATETEDEVVVVATSSKTRAGSRKSASPKKPRGGARVVPDSRAESPRGRKPSADEPTTSAPRRLSLPRRRRLAKGAPPQKLPSADELLVVPDSDEEKGRRKTRRNEKGASAEDAMDVDALLAPSSTFGAPTLLSPDSAPGPSAEGALALPAHRLRAANPRVKVADDPHLTDVNGPDAIEVKARFMKRAANGADQASSSGRRAVVSGSKAGPGRSSATLFPENNTTRLTAQKGILTSVKPKKTSTAASEEAASVAALNGDASMEIDAPVFDFVDVPDSGPSGQLDVEPEPEVAPTGQELLNAAGVDDKAMEDLPDFEEDAEGEVDVQNAPDAEVEVYVFVFVAVEWC